MNAIPVSKVLVLDESPEHQLAIKNFCDDNGLIALKVRRGSVTSVLRTNIDLGAILLSENYGGSPEEAARTAARPGAWTQARRPRSTRRSSISPRAARR